MIDFSENTSIRIIDNEVFASRMQIMELYDSPKKTIEENINKLKINGLIVGAKIRPNFGRPYEA
jgi:hypothetical protein